MPDVFGLKSRRATHSGSWYTSNGPELRKQLSSWMEKAQVDMTQTSDKLSQEGTQSVRAIIAPHAGYSYSGSTAAYAYSRLKHSLSSPETRRVFVLGPSHHAYIKGCAVSTVSSFNTPIGPLRGDRETVEKLLQTEGFEPMKHDVDDNEHSIEMQLPYIAELLESSGRREHCFVVTIMVGSTSPESEVQLGTCLAPYLVDPANVFVISTDFCHWGGRFGYQTDRMRGIIAYLRAVFLPLLMQKLYDKSKGKIHEFVEWLDHIGMSLIENKDVVGFYAYLESFRNTICGRHPVGVFLQAAKAAGLEDKLQIKFVHYSMSTKCQTKNDSSVSYASAVVCMPS